MANPGQPGLAFLPLVAEKVAGRMAVLVDGGVRRGADVLKALALGASAVLILLIPLPSLSRGCQDLLRSPIRAQIERVGVAHLP